MESILRGVAVYAFLFLIFRIAGKRTLAQTSPFEVWPGFWKFSQKHS
jgi:uncharacterized membrane protein YcaP (DUF421 family)